MAASSESKPVQVAERVSRITNPVSKCLYTLEEAGHYLGRTLWSMRELIWKGSIPIVGEGKRIFVDVNDLESYISKYKMIHI